MPRYLGVLAAVLLLTLALPASVAARDDVPPGPTVRHMSRTDGLPISGEYEIIQWVLDFAPGAWSPVHIHGGKVFATVIAGQLTRRVDGVETIYKTGESFIEMPDHPHSAGNAGNETVTLWVTAVLPRGQTLTTVVGTPDPNPPPAPVARYMYRTVGWPQSGPYEIVQLVLDFAPGVSTPSHTHGGVLPTTVLAGELTMRSGENGDSVYRVGETFLELPGGVQQILNATDQAATVAASVIVPRGTPITTVLPSLNCLYFTETAHSLCMGFRTYWEAYGGLAIFGYPLSEESVNDDGVVSQWFERARFEWHPGAWPERYDVLLGRIGAELMDGSGVVAGTSTTPSRDWIASPYRRDILLGRPDAQSVER